MKTVKNKHQSWTEEEEQILIRMWNEGCYSHEICTALNKTKGCIASYLTRNRDTLGLEKRPTNYRKKHHTYKLHGTKFMKAFDKQWHGSVPPKHWTITQSWSRG
jgi:IS30 family transposase